MVRPFEFEFERAFQDVSDLLAFVMVLRHHRALGEEYLRHHGFVAADDLARDGLAQDLFVHLLPGVMFHVPAIVHAATLVK